MTAMPKLMPPSAWQAMLRPKREAEPCGPWLETDSDNTRRCWQCNAKQGPDCGKKPKPTFRARVLKWLAIGEGKR